MEHADWDVSCMTSKTTDNNHACRFVAQDRVIGGLEIQIRRIVASKGVKQDGRIRNFISRKNCEKQGRVTSNGSSSIETGKSGCITWRTATASAKPLEIGISRHEPQSSSLAEGPVSPKVSTLVWETIQGRFPQQRLSEASRATWPFAPMHKTIACEPLEITRRQRMTLRHWI